MSTPAGRLVVCPTPIGNLEDVTLRVLRGAARRRRHRLRGHPPHRHPARPLRRRPRRCVSNHEHNERARAVELVGADGARRHGGAGLRRGHAARLGPRLRARPGAASTAGLPVEVLPGPSSALAALVASGLPTDRWRFVGFLPRKRGRWSGCCAPRRRRSWPSRRRSAWWPRLSRWRRAAPNRPAAVCRELTKVHEEVRRGTACALARALRRARSARRGRARDRAAPPGRARPGGRWSR